MQQRLRDALIRDASDHNKNNKFIDILPCLARSGYTIEAIKCVQLCKTTFLIGRDSDGGLPELWDVIGQYLFPIYAGVGNIKKILSIIRWHYGHLNYDKAFINACQSGNIDIIKFLIEFGADIHTEDNIVLRSACKFGRFNVIQFFVERGTDIHKFNEGLFFACKHAHINIVKFLVEHGVDIHVDNDIALKVACKLGNYRIVKFIIEKGVDIHAENERFLRIACKNGHTNIVELLVKHGANIYTSNAIIIAIRYEKYDIIKYLINRMHSENQDIFRFGYRSNI